MKAPLVRTGLIVLALSQGAAGLWALASPHGWWSSFPGFGRHWIRPLGPYNDELVRDFGAMYVALSAAMVWSAFVLERRAVQAVLLAQIVFLALHAFFVSFKLSLLPPGDRAGLMGGIAATGAVSVALLAQTRRER
jgi:hypothetical protein